MLFRNMMLKYHAEAGEDGEDGGAGGPADTSTVKTYTQAEVDAMVGGLKAKADELLAEKKAVSNKAKEEAAARLLAEQEAAKKSGSLEQLEQSLRGQFDKEKGELSSKLEALTSRVLGESKKAVLGSFTSEFLVPESVDIISQLVKTEFDGTDVKTQFTDFSGRVITTDSVEFKKWMANHPSISGLMKADAASGGGAPGSKGASVVKTFAQMTLTERAQLANSDPAQYARLSQQK